ncbi:kynurenine 3-monooxygenase, mitochondrial precursor, partial [Massospora cicadina]
RGMLNEELINAAASLENIRVIFEHELKSCDLECGSLTFLKSDGEEEVFVVDLVFGADGAYSRVRTEIMKKTCMDYSQAYIDHGHSYMMIALPNMNRSFTCTLFAPLGLFDSIKNEEQLLELFNRDLADAIPLIGRASLIEEYFANPKGSLMTIKCKPYHFKGRAVIVGDAAHCMVPFYGQGMNAGFEDINNFFEILDKAGLGSGDSPINLKAMELCLEEYSATRHPDVVAICNLALDNYVEMRSSVVSFSYQIRNRVEAFLHRVAPRFFIPLYTMVSFSNMRYSMVWQRWQRQASFISLAIGASSTMAFALAFVTAYYFLKPTPRAPPSQTTLEKLTQSVAVPIGWAAYTAGRVYRHIKG